MIRHIDKSRSRQLLVQGGGKINYDREIIELKKRVKELEECYKALEEWKAAKEQQERWLEMEALTSLRI